MLRIGVAIQACHGSRAVARLCIVASCMFVTFFVSLRPGMEEVEYCRSDLHDFAECLNR